MLGIEWAKRIADNYADRPGPQPGTVNNPQGHNQHTDNEDNTYAHKYYPQDKTQYGTSKAYLLERLPDEVVAEIGKGKRYKSVHEAARVLAAVGRRGVCRLCLLHISANPLLYHLIQ